MNICYFREIRVTAVVTFRMIFYTQKYFVCIFKWKNFSKISEKINLKIKMVFYT